jgi:type I restriction enzyme S subunit
MKKGGKLEGWKVEKIGDVCEVIAGQSPEGKYYNKKGNGLPFYQGKKDFEEKFLGEPTTWTTNVTKEAQQGDILMSVRAPVGPVNFATGKICIGRGLAAIRASKLIDKEFLFYFFLKHESEIVGNAGAVFSSINKAQIESIELPLPLLPEQKRIVSVLDEAFASIAQAKSNAERNLVNARELFESVSKEIFKGNGKGWKVKKIGNICSLMTGGTPSRSKLEYFTNGKIRWLVSGDIHQKEVFDCEGRITEKGFQDSNAKYLPINSVLIALNGQGKTRGTVALLRTKATCNQSLVSIYPNNIEELMSEFIYQNLNSRYQEIRRITGDDDKDRRGLNMLLVRAIEIPLPPLAEQRAIVGRLKALSAETKRLEEIYQSKVEGLEELKKSVLGKAFNGELNLRN